MAYLCQLNMNDYLFDLLNTGSFLNYAWFRCHLNHAPFVLKLSFLVLILQEITCTVVSGNSESILRARLALSRRTVSRPKCTMAETRAEHRYSIKILDIDTLKKYRHRYCRYKYCIVYRYCGTSWKFYRKYSDTAVLSENCIGSIAILRCFSKIVSQCRDTFDTFTKCTGDTPILSRIVPVTLQSCDTFKYLYRWDLNTTILSINTGTGGIQI